MKKVLILHYSQSGQLTQILESIVSGFVGGNVNFEHQYIEPTVPYPFPWNSGDFFDQMPDSVLHQSHEIKPITFNEARYDLIILGYQVWFLNPSIPFNSFLSGEQAKYLFQNTPVITVLGVRNMWVMAQEKVKQKLHALGANLVGNIVFEDKNPNLISVITIQHWLFSGKKSRFLGFFPMPGVAESDIQGATKFGATIEHHLLEDSCNNLQGDLVKQNAVRVVDTLVFIEKRATMLFGLWAKLIERKSTSPKKRKFWLKVFNVYLLFALFIISPFVVLIYTVSKLFRIGAIRKDKLYYQGVNLKE